MIDNITERIAWALNYLNTKKKHTWVDLGKRLYCDKDTVAAYSKEKGLMKGIVLEKLVSDPELGFISIWLLEGKGEPFPGAREEYPEVCGPSIGREVDCDLGKDKKVSTLGFSDKRFIQGRRWSDKTQEGKVGLSVQASILISNILSSDNQAIIQSTIANLRAFSQAIDTQQKNRIKKLEERLAALEEALRSGDPHKIELSQKTKI